MAAGLRMLPMVTQVEVELAAVGRNMAGLRRSKSLRLSDLAEATGDTTSHLSQIERGVSVPSLTALAMVAMALRVEMTALLDTATGPLVHITRAGEGRELRLPGSPSFPGRRKSWSAGCLHRHHPGDA